MPTTRRAGLSRSGGKASTTDYKYPFGYNISKGLARFFAARALSASQIVKINWIGHSLVRGEYSSDETMKSPAAVLKSILATTYGDSGAGFIAAREGYTSLSSQQAASGVNGAAKRVNFIKLSDSTVYSPMDVTGGFAGTFAQHGNGNEVRFTATGNKFKIFYMDRNGGSGGKASIKVDGTAVLTNVGDSTVTVDTPRMVEITTAPGAHTITTSTTQGNFNTIGIIAETAASGIQVNRCGKEAWKAHDWANRGDTMHLSWALNAPHLTILQLLANDIKDQPIATYKANMGLIIQRCLDMGSDVAIYVDHRFGSSWLNHANWPQYVVACYELADQYGVALIDGYEAFNRSHGDAVGFGFMGINPNDYTGLAGSDAGHCSDNGYKFIAQTVARILSA